MCDTKNTGFFILIGLLLVFTHSFSQNRAVSDSLGRLLKQEDLSKEERSRILSLRAYYLQKIDSALISAKLALSIAKEINNPLLIARAWEEIGVIERRLGNNPASLQASLTALRIFDSLGLNERKAASYAQLAGNAISDEDYGAAIDYFRKANAIYDISDKNGNQILTLLNLGEAYRLAGQLDSATTYFKETLKRNETLKHDIVQSYSLGNLGMVQFAQGNLIKAKENLVRAIEIVKPIEDPYSTSIYLAELGEIHLKENDGPMGEAKLLEAHQIAVNAGLKEQIRDFSRTLSDFYKKQKRHSEALEYLELNRIYQDSLVNKASIKKMEQLKAGYEIAKRETEIDLLHTKTTDQKNKLKFLGVGIFIFSILAYLLFRSNRALQKVNRRVSAQSVLIEKRNQEKALLLKELNHRVKNNLQMISSLLNLQSREFSGHPAQEALITGKNRVEALALVHRKLYQEGSETKVVLKDYIEDLVLGLFYGYDVSFTPKLDIDNTSISVDTAIPIALIVNELVVNALKYAYKGIDVPNFALTLKKANDTLEMDIRDNGVGFTVAEVDKENSFGIKLITALVKQLDGHIERSVSEGTHWKMRLKSA